MASLVVVGLGFGAGEQVTLRGHELLLWSRWIGHFALPPALAGFLARYAGAEMVDLDAALGSQANPDGFTARALQVAAAAAWRLGLAAVAVAGHPCFANNFTRLA